MSRRTNRKFFKNVDITEVEYAVLHIVASVCNIRYVETVSLDQIIENEHFEDIIEEIEATIGVSIIIRMGPIDVAWICDAVAEAIEIYNADANPYVMPYSNNAVQLTPNTSDVERPTQYRLGVRHGVTVLQGLFLETNKRLVTGVWRDIPTVNLDDGYLQ